MRVEGNRKGEERKVAKEEDEKRLKSFNGEREKERGRREEGIEEVREEDNRKEHDKAGKKKKWERGNS